MNLIKITYEPLHKEPHILELRARASNQRMSVGIGFGIASVLLKRPDLGEIVVSCLGSHLNDINQN